MASNPLEREGEAIGKRSLASQFPWTQRVNDAIASDDYATMHALVDEANEANRRLCHGWRWTMHIPVQNTDTDIVFGNLANLAGQLIDGMEEVRRQRDAWREFAEHVDHCVECSQMGDIGDCFERKQLKAALEALESV